MSDLISRCDLYKEICSLKELAMDRVLDTPINSPCYMRYSVQLSERTVLKHLVHDAPTAYDVDKVLAELEDLAHKYGSESNRRKGIEQAIEIVRKGGVDGNKI